LKRESLGEIFVGLPQKRLDGEIEVDAAGVTGHAGVEAADRLNSGRDWRGAFSHSDIKRRRARAPVGPPRPP